MADTRFQSPLPGSASSQSHPVKVTSSLALSIRSFFEHNFLRRTKIQVRLISSFILLCVLPLLIIAIIAYNQSSGAIRSKIETYSVQVMNQAGGNIRLEVNKFFNYANELELLDSFDNILDYKSLTDINKVDANNKISQDLKNRFLKVKDVKLVSVQILDAAHVSHGDGNLLSDAELRETDKSVEGTDGEPVLKFIDKGDAKLFAVCKENFEIAISDRIKSNRLGSTLICMDESHFSALYKDINLGKGGEIFIMDGAGKVISSANPGAVPVGSAYKQAELTKYISASMKNKKQYFTSKISGSDYLVAFSSLNIPGGKYYLVGTVPFSYLNAESKSLLIMIVSIGILCLFLALVLSFAVTRSIASPLKKLVEFMLKAKNGDLTSRMEDDCSDELSVASHTFNDMVSNIHSLVLKVNSSARGVLDNAEKISEASEKSYMASEMIASTIQEIAKGSSQQAADVSENVTHMSRLSDNINQVSDETGVVSEVVNNTQKLSGNALASVKTLSDKAMESNTVSQKTVQDINDLNEDMKEIKKIIQAIVSISDQTNLLSLNAAIEAARAGEAGRGFAVVASEVKKLADQSKEASVAINNIINKIWNKTEITVNTANSANAIIKQQMEAVKDTENAFKSIFTAMSGIAGQMKNVQNSVKEIISSKQNAVDSIQNISAVTEEAAATVEEVSASTEEQLAEYEELADLAKNLNEVAKDLSEAIAVFKVEW